MEKNKIYVIHPGDVIYLLRGQYPLRLEERPVKESTPETEAKPTETSTTEEVKIEMKVEELEIKMDELDEDPGYVRNPSQLTLG